MEAIEAKLNEKETSFVIKRGAFELALSEEKRHMEVERKHAKLALELAVAEEKE